MIDNDIALAAIVDQLSRIADSLEALAAAKGPAAPNLTRDIADFAGFDWASIGAHVTAYDQFGPSVVEHRGQTYKRRSPENKFGAAIWYSRPVGKDDEGRNIYARLVTFKEITPAEPISRSAEAKAAVHPPAQPQAARPKPANGNGNGKPPARPIQPPEPPPWEEFEDEFERMPPAAREPEQAAALAKAAAAAPKASLPAIAAQPDRAQLARIHELIDSKGARFSGAASKEQYGLLRRLVDSHTNGNKQAADLLIARMVGSEVARVKHPDWLPAAAACAGVIDFLAHRLPSGDLVRPLELDPARKADLAVILGAAWKAAGLAGEPDLSEKIPF